MDAILGTAMVTFSGGVLPKIIQPQVLGSQGKQHASGKVTDIHFEVTESQYESTGLVAFQKQVILARIDQRNDIDDTENQLPTYDHAQLERLMDSLRPASVYIGTAVPQAKADLPGGSTSSEPLKATRKDWRDPFEQQLSEVADPAEGTCHWISKDETFSSWNANESKVLMIIAYPGLGKTVLAKAIHTMLTTEGSRKTLPFFCKTGKDKRNSLTAVLSSWIYSLLSSNRERLIDPENADYIGRNEPLLSSINDVCLPMATVAQEKGMTVGNLWKLLVELGKLSFAKSYAFILDALDECTERSQAEFFKALITPKNEFSCPLIITARPYAIPVALAEMYPKIEILPEMLTDDINSFVKHLFKEARVEAFVNQDFLEQVRMISTDRAYGLFLLVSCRVNEILHSMHEPGFTSTPDHFRILVDKQFRPVMDYFGSMLDPLAQSPQVDKGAAVLNLLLVSQAPLSNAELTASFMFSRKRYSDYKSYLTDGEKPSDIFRDSKDLCGSILRINGPASDPERTIDIVHETVRQFLLSGGVSDPTFPPSQLALLQRINLLNGHLLMAQACLRYLILPRDINDLLSNREQTRDFLSYAWQFWPLHVRESAQRVVEYQGLLSDFFASKLAGYKIWADLGAILATSEEEDGETEPQSIAITLERNDLMNVLDCMKVTSKKGIVDLFGILVDLNEGPETRDTALLLAVASEKSEMAVKLLELGADATIGRNGFTAIHLAAALNMFDVLRKCAETKADLDIECKYMKSDGSGIVNFRDPPLFWSINEATEDSLQCFELLIELGAKAWFRKVDGGSILHAAASVGHIEIIRSILSKHFLLDVNYADENGVTALMTAAETSDRSLDAVRCLLECDADADLVDNGGRTALIYAIDVDKDDVVKLLLAVTREIDSAITDESVEAYGWTALHLAASIGSEAIVAELVSKRADVNMVTNEGENALMLATRGGFVTVIDILIQHESKIDIHLQDGSYALQLAATRGYLDIVEMLLTAGAVDEPEKNGISALHMAAWCGHDDIARKLINKSPSVADLNKVQQPSGYTPLLCALSEERLNIVKMLVGSGANEYVVSSSGWTPLHFVCEHEKNAELFDFVFGRTQDEFINDRTDTGVTPLMIAAENAFLHAVEILLKRGADDTMINKNGGTALMLAGASGSAQIVNLLLDCPDQAPNTRDKHGWTALHYACCKLHDQLTLQRIVKCTTWNHRQRSSPTPMMVAVAHGNKDAVKVLLHNKMPADFLNDAGNGPLYESAEQSDVEIVLLLLDAGADRSQFTAYNAIPLMLALHDPQPEIVKALTPESSHHLCRRASTILVNGANEAAKGSLDVLQWMVENGVNPAARSSLAETVFHTAAERGRSDIVQYLLSLPAMHALADEPSDISGTTPLMHAIWSRDIDTIESLITLGNADPWLRDIFGFCALEYAFANRKILEAFTSLVPEVSQVWRQKARDIGEQLHHLYVSILSLIRFLESSNYSRNGEYQIRKKAMGCLSRALFFVNDQENGIVAAEHVYGLPSKSTYRMYCDSCQHTKKTYLYICMQRPYYSICNDCKENGERIQAMDCAEHDWIRVPSETWHARNPKYVNDDNQTLEMWIEDVRQKYTTIVQEQHKRSVTESTLETTNEVSNLRLQIKFDYATDRTDVLELISPEMESALSEHLLRYPRDVWYLDEHGNSLAMVIIQRASEDSICMHSLSNLQFEGGRMLERNVDGESTVTQACKKAFQRTVSFLLSCYDDDFAATCVNDNDRLDSFEAIKIIQENQWREALEFALDRHFGWVSQGDYEFLKTLDLIGMSTADMVEVLLKRDQIETSSLDETQEQALMTTFTRSQCFSSPDSNLHLQNCVHALSKANLKTEKPATGEDHENVKKLFSDPSDDKAGGEVDYLAAKNGLSKVEGFLGDGLAIDRISSLCGYAGLTSPLGLSILESKNGTQVQGVLIRYGAFSDHNHLETIRAIILDAKSGLLQAMYEAQEADICCESFSVLVDKPGTPGSESYPMIRLVRITFELVLKFLQGITSGPDTDISSLRISDVGLNAGVSIKSLFSQGEIDFSDDPTSSLELAAEVIQVLSMAFVSFIHGHVADSELPFLTGDIPATTFGGIKGSGSIFIRPKSMACVGSMLQRKLLVFGEKSDNQDISSENLELEHLLLTDIESILEIWGPGTLVTEDMLGIRHEKNIVAVQIQKGYVTLTGEYIERLPVAHWALAGGSSTATCGWTVYTSGGHSIDGESLLSGLIACPADLLTFRASQPLILGMLRPRYSCNVKQNTIDSFYKAEPELYPLGTSDEYWRTAVRQVSLAAGHWGVQVQATLGQTLIPKHSLKSIVVDEWQKQHKQSDLGYSPWVRESFRILNSPYGLVCSLCNGFAQRVPLREAIAAAWHASMDAELRPESTQIDDWNKFVANTFAALKGSKPANIEMGSASDPDAQLASFLKDKCDLWQKVFIHTMIGQILGMLEHTGLSEDHEKFRIAWLHADAGAKAYEFPLSRPLSDWIQFVQDNRRIATFAIFTNECLVEHSMHRIRCSNSARGYAIPRAISLLSTKVFRLERHGKDDDRHLNLVPEQYCFLVCDEPKSKKFACHIQKYGRRELKTTGLLVLKHTREVFRAYEILCPDPAEEVREYHLKPPPAYDISENVIITPFKDWRNLDSTT